MNIDITGVIVSNDDKIAYDWLGIEATCPRDVLNNIRDADGEMLDVNINSGGGDVFAGNEIYTALRNYSGGLKIHVIYAASAASVIMCAGHSDITPPGMVMVHNVCSVARGDYHEMDHASEMLQTANAALAAAYAAKSGRPETEILKMMDRETWLTAARAVELGLVDDIAPERVELVASSGGMLPRAAIEKIRNTARRPQLNADVLFYTKQAMAQLNYLKLEGKNI